MIEKIVSGGQTGVDRAALDIAIKLAIPIDGWCPKGRLAEDGIIPRHYLLTEAKTSEYSERTKLNIRDSDGTLILIIKTASTSNGTALTITEAEEKNKPYLIIDLSKKSDISSITHWVTENNIHTLNIAGPRESQTPGIYQLSLKFLEDLLCQLILDWQSKHCNH